MLNVKYFYLLLMLSLFLSIATSVFAKYSNEINFNISNGKIAIPVFNVTTSYSLDSNEIVSKDGKVFSFLDVSNFNDKSLSNVGFKYYLQLYSNDVDLSDFNICIKKDDNVLNLNHDKTEEFVLLANEKQSHHFVIEINYSSNKLNNNIVGLIKLKIISEQLIP